MTKKRHSAWLVLFQILVVFIVSALFSKASFVANQKRADPQPKAKSYALAIPESAE
ncbi:MAG TPA: hypothetical protein VIG33_13240 [Pseudobdellovibrionaceae bacterium]|jgi:hypothetical protein